MRKQQSFQWQALTVGTCYYPEHWPEKLWADDLKRMQQAGIQCIRIAEFAWSKVELHEGAFSFDFFDRFLDLCKAMGMKVIFSTPTATPPAWLTEKYPEVLNCRQDGVPYRHGMRRHYNYNSPVYQQLSARIVEQLAAHYAKHPVIVGWQIDNELNCECADFYSESDNAAFRRFLQERYGTLDALNQAWGTVFWNQTYTDWQEVHVPRTTVQNSTNPHQTLDYIRFVSDSAVRFCKMQSEILRRYVKPGDFITTNGMFGHLDNHRMTDEALDVYTYDSYPNFAYGLDSDPKATGAMNDRSWSRHLDEVRSICPHFGIMEQQSGANGWNTRMEAPAPKPGQLMLWAMQSVAHGADYVSFFRWRTATMGTEIYWHGILDYDNHDNRKLAEVTRFADRLTRLDGVAGSDYCTSVAVVRDYDNLWDADVDRWHSRVMWASENEMAAMSQLTHTPMDYLYLTETTELAELTKYAVLVYPHPLILTEKREDLLKAYVARGGKLVLCARAGQKDITGQCVMDYMPGLLKELTGSIVKDFTLIGPGDDPVTMTLNGQRLPAGLFNDVLAVNDPAAEVLASYDNNYYAGEPALVRHPYGKGFVLHFGGTLTRETAAALLSMTGVLTPWADVISMPDDCELCVREKAGKHWFFVLNYAARPVIVCLHKMLTDIDTDHPAYGDIRLDPYEVKVYMTDSLHP